MVSLRTNTCQVPADVITRTMTKRAEQTTFGERLCQVYVRYLNVSIRYPHMANACITSPSGIHRWRMLA